MARGSVTVGNRTIPVNVSEPIGLLLGEACQHFAESRLLRIARKPWVRALIIACAPIAIFVAPAVTVRLALGLVGLWFTLVALYLCWHARFIHLNRIFQTLCPRCTSRMWQLCCARCGEPVPPLALWLKGMFLAHCPHCGLRLSSSRGTLLAWCSTCSEVLNEPGDFYGKPTFVIVWINNSLPSQIAGNWKRLAQSDEGKLALYDRKDSHSASLMYVCTDYHLKEVPLDEHLIRRTRLLLISDDIPEIQANRIRGFFGPSTICEGIEPIN